MKKTTKTEKKKTDDGKMTCPEVRKMPWAKDMPEGVLRDMEECGTLDKWVWRLIWGRPCTLARHVEITFPSSRNAVLLDGGMTQPGIMGNMKVIMTGLSAEQLSLTGKKLIITSDETGKDIRISWKSPATRKIPEVWVPQELLEDAWMYDDDGEEKY